jgi:hypothetical protein
MQSNSTPAPKPELVIDLDGPAAVLQALSCLSALKSGASFHDVHDQRHPLGTYNLSVGRICDKLQKCAANLERYWLSSPTLADLDKHADFRRITIDYLELCLYAAAEHVDDVESVASSFFRTSRQAAKAAAMKQLKRAVKPLRDRIASLTNTVKHRQGRLRLFSLEFNHDSKSLCLHGFFIEGFTQGQVCPSPILHGNGEIVISITSFLWSILMYVWLISLQLEQFLVAVSAIDMQKIQPVGSPLFRADPRSC